MKNQKPPLPSTYVVHRRKRGKSRDEVTAVTRVYQEAERELEKSRKKIKETAECAERLAEELEEFSEQEETKEDGS